jgi:glycosyltransferase involved in cell wall biosynthesis
MALLHDRRLLCAFFQELPPDATAVALRGHTILAALAASDLLAQIHLQAFTTTALAHPISDVELVTLDIEKIENRARLSSRLFSELRMGWLLARKIRAVRKHCDLVLISSPSYVTALVVTFFARLHKLRYVLDLRDIYPQVYAEAGLLRRRSLAYRFLDRQSTHMYRGAVRVLAATRGLKREVLDQAPNTQVDVVYNGFPAALSLRVASKYERFTVCFHGVLGFFQDVEALIEVARRLGPAGIDVVVIGYGRKQELLEKAGLANLRFLGRLSFDQTIVEIERCHVGLCLRLDDGVSKDAFPVKVWEYIGLGMPAIVTPLCEAGDFLEDLGCGYQFPSGKIEAIERAIFELRNCAGHYNRLVGNCRRQSQPFTRESLGIAAARLIAEDVTGSR